jgi:hypothetical protein
MVELITHIMQTIENPILLPGGQKSEIDMHDWIEMYHIIEKSNSIIA